MSFLINYTIRDKCIFCDNNLLNHFFSSDLNHFVGHYTVDIETKENSFIRIPYNVLICEICNTIQNKYLGELTEIYKINHNDGTGNIMVSLFDKIVNIICENKNDINNILEIGSSYGKLADKIISNSHNIKYYIVEPSYAGSKDNKTIIYDFYENINDTLIDANTIIMSHVFEHFYNPKQILEKIYNNYNINNVILANPNLEYYINNNIHNVLTTEHTYYIDNNFLINIFDNYGFKLYQMEDHFNHSIIFVFKRYRNNILNNIYKNVNFSLHNYYNNIFKTVERYNNIILSNKDKDIYIWPASIHTLYMCNFGLYYDKLYGFLDNSINKINRKMYGVNKIVYSFKTVLEENKSNTIIILNGGLFNMEVRNKFNNSEIIIYE
jgi:hypothetical protein